MSLKKIRQDWEEKKDDHPGYNAASWAHDYAEKLLVVAEEALEGHSKGFFAEGCSLCDALYKLEHDL